MEILFLLILGGGIVCLIAAGLAAGAEAFSRSLPDEPQSNQPDSWFV